MAEQKNEQIPAAEPSTKEEPKTTGNNEKFLQQEPTAENEIHVAAKGHIKNYLGYAFRILNKTNHQQLKIRATGNAIVKANILIELVKRRVGDLHQLNSIYSMVISSSEEKLGEKIETKRRVTAMDTLLSKSPLDTADPGYQEPAPKDEPYQSQSRPGGQNRKGAKKDDQRRRGPKLYNAPMGGDDDGDNKDKKRGPGKDRQEADKNDKRGKRSRRDKINQPAVKDDEQARRSDRGGRGRGGYTPQDAYGRPAMGDGRHMQYNAPMDQRGGYDNHRNHNQSRHMPPYMMYANPRSYDDFGVRPHRGQTRGGRGYDNRGRGHMQQDHYRRPMNDMYMYGPPSYDHGNHSQNYYGGGGYDYYRGPPPDRRYPPRERRDEHGQNDGQSRYNDRPPRNYNERGPSERFNAENPTRGRGGYNDRGPNERSSQTSEKDGAERGGYSDRGHRGRMTGGPADSDSRGGRQDRDHQRPGETREEAVGEKPYRPRDDRENRDARGYQPRGDDDSRGAFRGGDNQRRGYQSDFRGGGGHYGGFRQGGPRGDFRGGGGDFRGGPHRDNDADGGRSRFNQTDGHFRGGDMRNGDGPPTRGVRGSMRGGYNDRGDFRGRGNYGDRGRGGMDRPEGGPMHRINDRRDDPDMPRRGMQPYRGRGMNDEAGGDYRGGRGNYNDRGSYGDYRGRGERGGFSASERGEGGDDRPARTNHKISQRSRGGLATSDAGPVFNPPTMDKDNDRERPEKQ